MGSYPTFSPLLINQRYLSVALVLGSPPAGVTRYPCPAEPGLSSSSAFRHESAAVRPGRGNIVTQESQIVKHLANFPDGAYTIDTNALRRGTVNCCLSRCHRRGGYQPPATYDDKHAHFIRKRSQIVTFRAANSRPYGSIVRILKTIFLSGIGRGAQRMLVHHPGFVTHWPRALPDKQQFVSSLT